MKKLFNAIIFSVLVVLSISVCKDFIYLPAKSWAESQQTSGITATTVINRARELLHDPTTYGGTQSDIYSDTEMLQWVNDGVYDLCLHGAMVDTTTIGLTSNTPNYTIASKFYGIKGVIYNSEKSLEKGNFYGRHAAESFGHITGETGEPEFYTVHGNDVWIYPIPDATAGANSVDVMLYSRPASDITASQAVPTPKRYDQALTYFVVGQALLKDSRFLQAQLYLNLYDRTITIAQSHEHPRQQTISEKKP